MSAIRLSVAARQDGATNGQVPIWNNTTGKWGYGSPVPGAHTHVESDVTSLVTDLAAKVAKATATAKGDLLVATASGVITNLPVGANNFILTADSTQASGIKWAAAPAVGITVQDENANVATGVTQLDFQGAGVTATLGTGEVVVTIPGGGGGFTDPTTTKGDLIVHGATTTRLPVGTDGQVLTVDSTQAAGMKWAAAPGGGGGTLTIQDENSSVATGVTQIDFQGAGVTATPGTGEVIVTVPAWRQATTSKTSAYTAAYGDIVLADATSASFTVTLPTASSAQLPVTVKKIDASTNTVTVAPATGTIDGSATIVISTRYASYDLVSDGTNWFIV